MFVIPSAVLLAACSQLAAAAAAAGTSPTRSQGGLTGRSARTTTTTTRRQDDALPPAFFLAGDSMTAVQSTGGGGWGNGFLSFLSSPAWGTNYGKNGATTVSFVDGGYWASVISAVEGSVGDYDPFVTIMVSGLRLANHQILVILCQLGYRGEDDSERPGWLT